MAAIYKETSQVREVATNTRYTATINSADTLYMQSSGTILNPVLPPPVYGSNIEDDVLYGKDNAHCL